MLPRTILPVLFLSPRKLVPIFFILSWLVSSCTTTAPTNPVIETVEPLQPTMAEVFTPTTQVPEITPTETSENDTAQVFSSEPLGICFSYPQGYTQVPYNDTVEIAAPMLPGTDTRGLFWLEISDAYNRTAEVIADQDLTNLASSNVGRWNVTLGGEQALVLDGMPGQDAVRNVYIVHDQTLYILTFSPTRSENGAASVQMEILYAAVMSSWAWSPCPASK